MPSPASWRLAPLHQGWQSSTSTVIISCYNFLILSFDVIIWCYHLFMLSFIDVIIWCYHLFYVIVWCYNFTPFYYSWKCDTIVLAPSCEWPKTTQRTLFWMFKPTFTAGLYQRGASQFPAARNSNLCFNWMRGICASQLRKTAHYLINYGYEQTGSNWWKMWKLSLRSLRSYIVIDKIIIYIFQMHSG